MRRVLCVALLLGLVSAGAAAVEIHGDILTDYRDGQRDVTGGVSGTANGQFRLQSADLIVTDDITDLIRVLARGSSSRGGRLTLSEAWLQFDGLPWAGSFTLGRSFPPGGAPLPTLDVSLPTILYRSQVQDGAKFHFEPTDNWRFEAGLFDLNPLSATGASIGDAFVLARPSGNPNGNGRRLFGHLGWQDGGSWGSVDLSTNYYYSHLSAGDIAVVNGSGMFRSPTGERTHEVLEFSGDYLYGPYRVYGQWVHGTEGQFRQDAWEVAGSYRWNDLTGILSYGQHRNNVHIRGTSIANSWNRDRLSASLAFQLTPLVKVQGEYEFNWEDVGLVGNDDFVDNNAIGVQVLAVF